MLQSKKKKEIRHLPLIHSMPLESSLKCLVSLCWPLSARSYRRDWGPYDCQAGRGQQILVKSAELGTACQRGVWFVPCGIIFPSIDTSWEPLTQSLLLWGRQSGASSGYHAVRLELHSSQHPVENAQASQEPHHGLYCEYRGPVISDMGVVPVTVRPSHPCSSYRGPLTPTLPN